MGPQIPTTIQAELDKLRHLVSLALGASGSSFARNSAVGPASSTPVPQTPAVVNVPWSNIASTGAAGASVPITPESSGKLRITGVVFVEMTGELAEDYVNVFVLVNGVQVGAISSDIGAPTGNGNSFVAVPILMDVSAPVGVTAQVAVHVQVVNQSSSAITLPAGSVANGFTSLDVQEVRAATG